MTVVPQRLGASIAHWLRFGLMVVIALAPLGCGERGPQRLPDSGFQVAFESHKIASEMPSRQTVSADITVKNISPVTWPSKPDKKDRYAVNLSYHWLDRKGATIVFDGLRTPLPRDLKPGESVDLRAAIQAPEKAGRYILEVTLVQERWAWFPEKNGAAKLVIPVAVFEAGAVAAESGPAPVVSAAVSAETKSKKTPPAEKAVKPQSQIATISRAAAPAADRGGSWSVQLASYGEKDVAARLAKKLKDKGYDAYVTPVNLNGKEWHRVSVGRFDQRGQAEKMRETLGAAEKLERAIVTNR